MAGGARQNSVARCAHSHCSASLNAQSGSQFCSVFPASALDVADVNRSGVAAPNPNLVPVGPDLEVLKSVSRSRAVIIRRIEIAGVAKFATSFCNKYVDTGLC